MLKGNGKSKIFSALVFYALISILILSPLDAIFSAEATPDNSPPSVRKARELFKKENYAAAVETMRAVYQENPDDPDIEQSYIVILYDSAKKLYDKGVYHESLSICTELHDSNLCDDNQKANVLVLAIDSMDRSGKIEEAVSYLHEIEKVGGYEDFSLEKFAAIAVKTRDFAAAEKLLGELLKKSLFPWKALEKLEQLFKETGDKAKLADIYRKILYEYKFDDYTRERAATALSIYYLEIAEFENLSKTLDVFIRAPYTHDRTKSPERMKEAKEFYKDLASDIKDNAALAGVCGWDNACVIATKYFKITTDYNPAYVKKLAVKLDVALDYVVKDLFGCTADKDFAGTVYFFKNRDEFRINAKKDNADFKEWMAGYYSPSERRMYVYMYDELHPEVMAETVYHEMTHHAAHIVFANFELPAWLSEGVAEYFSCMVYHRGKKSDFCESRWDRKETLLKERAAGKAFAFIYLVNYTYQNLFDEEKQSIFYAQSWSLLEFLLSRQPEELEKLGLYKHLRYQYGSMNAFVKNLKPTKFKPAEIEKAWTEWERANITNSAMKPTQ